MSTVTKSVEQLKLEAEQAQEALRKAEEEAHNKERDAKEAEERKQREAQEEKQNKERQQLVKRVAEGLWAEGLADAVTETNTITAHGWHRFRIIFNLRDAVISFEDQFRRVSKWRAFPTGKVVLFVHPHWELKEKTRRFPQKEDGSFNYKKIAELIRQYRAQIKNKHDAKQETANKVAAAKALAKKLVQELDVMEDTIIVGSYENFSYRGVAPHSVTCAPELGKVFVRLGTTQCTPEQARILVKAYKLVQAMKKDPKT